MPIVSLTDALAEGRRRGCGVANFWAGGAEATIGIVRAAEAMNAPIVLCYNRPLCPQFPMALGFAMMRSAAERMAVPIALTLDHGADPGECREAIECGATGVMYDGSHLPLEDNLEITREVVRMAHAAGVSVEAEVGSIGGSAIEYGLDHSVEGVFTDPESATMFVDATGIDALAISVGNAHGRYSATPRIRYDLVREIASRVSVPLVLHGASGLTDTEYQKIVDAGITKINYYSEGSRRVIEQLRAFLTVDRGEMLSHNVSRFLIEAWERETCSVLALLGHVAAD